MHRPAMSAVAEIEAAIEQLPPEDFRAVREWIVTRAEGTAGRQWSPEELGAAAEQMVAEKGPVRAGDLLFEPGDGGREILGDRSGQAGDLPGALGAKHGLELCAAGHPGRQFGLRGTGRGRRCRRVGRAELGEHLRVDPVGLGPLAPTPGKVPHLPRIDHRDGLAGGVQGGDDGPLPTAGGLADDLHGRPRRPQPGEHRRAARRIVGKAPGVALQVEVESGFGDVESGVDEGWIHSRNRLCLVDASSRLRQRFEFKDPRAGRFALKDGLQGPRAKNELFLTRCGAALTAPQLGVLQTFP